MLSYEGEQFLGVQSIMGKLGGMPSIRHKIVTFDAQPTFDNGILAFVSGDLIIDGYRLHVATVSAKLAASEAELATVREQFERMSIAADLIARLEQPST